MTRILRLGVLLLLGLAPVACGTAATPSPSATESQMPTASDDAGALGDPADAGSADRTVHLTASDKLVFDPDSIEVQLGETVTFEIENTGTVDHEFVLGSAAYQKDHEQEMQSGEMHMGDEPNAIEVPAGETASLTWTFTEAGSTEFGCHEPGHFPAGMLGTITVGE